MKTQQPFDLLHAYQQTRAEMRTGYGQHSFDTVDTIEVLRDKCVMLVKECGNYKGLFKLVKVRRELEVILNITNTYNRSVRFVLSCVRAASYEEMIAISRLLSNGN